MAKKNSYWGGWDEYRFGPKKKPSLAKVFDKGVRQRVVEDVLDLLRDWRATPFENEGPVRHSVRSAICLQGHSWPSADAEAEILVNSAFKSMGAHRPTWDQGQREYTLPLENCNWCSGALDEVQIMRRNRFCSTMCAQSAIRHRDWQTTLHESTIGRAAHKMIVRSQNPERPCAHCKRPFHPAKTGDQNYCSKTCADKGKIQLQQHCANPRCNKVFLPLSSGNKHYCSSRCRSQVGRCVQEISVKCEQCARPFVAARNDARFCGQRCRDQHKTDREAIAAGRQPRRVDDAIVRCCEYCGGTFSARSTRAGYCTVDCRTIAQGLRSGGWQPKKISRQVFDHLFRKPVNAAMKGNGGGSFRCASPNVIYLTAEIFDSWFKQAA
jgi:hypothetical protein